MNFRMICGFAAALVMNVACATAAPTVDAQPAAAPAPFSASASTLPTSAADYRLGVADKVRILVYNEPSLSGEFSVNSNGAIAVPLIGDVVAANKTTSQITADIQQRLADGYLRDPKVSIDVTTFRPYYILGEVNRPGQYPYSAGLTVLNAVATAQGFTYRADQRRVFIKNAGQTQESAQKLSSDLEVRPGDTIRIGERYF
jgi:protein involved in polysaccharide export with SLBB domain